MRIDRLDAQLIRLLTESPQLPILECARRLGIARGTATSRLARELAAMEATDEPTAQVKILDILRKAAAIHNK